MTNGTDSATLNSNRQLLTLSSHKGKAIIKADKNENFMGHPVFWFELGDITKAVEVEISNDFADGQYINIAGMDQGFDCAMGKYHDQNEIVTWKRHKGSNQRFCINQDRTISPCGCHNMVWGLREGDNYLVLVQKDSEHKLIFDNMPPSSLAFPEMKTMKFAPSNFPGKAVVATGYQKTKQTIAFGDIEDP